MLAVVIIPATASLFLCGMKINSNGMKTKNLFASKMERHLQKQKVRKADDFVKYYNELQQVSENKRINTDKFMFLLKFDNDVYEALTKAAKCVYPVLCSFADFEKNTWFHVPVSKLSSLSGLRPESVNKGIDNLCANQIVEKRMQHKGKKHYYIYKIVQIERMKGKYIIFYDSIILSGLWSRLSVRAKILYYTMRRIAEFDLMLYTACEDIEEYETLTSGSEFRHRKWDLVKASITELCRISGISRIEIKPVLNELQKNRLIDLHNANKGILQVYLTPNKLENLDV